jgi:DNA-binding NarL/FixJ family response regulator
MQKNVYIVDDHALFSNSLKMLIDRFPDFTVGLCFQNGKELIFALQNQGLPEPDIILLDINMPIMNGPETMVWLSKNKPGIPVLVLSMQDEEHLMLEMIKLGIKGYLLKDITPELLEKALTDTLTYGFFQSEKMTKLLIGALHKNNHQSIDLKDREKEFLKLICTEKTYKEIAEEMFLSPKTIDGYREALFEKLDVKSRVGLVLFAIKNGFYRV